MKNLLFIFNLLLITFTSYATECEVSNSVSSDKYIVGDNVHASHYSSEEDDYIWSNATVVAIQKEGHLVIKLNENNLNSKKYFSNVHPSYVYNNEACAVYMDDLTFTPGDSVVIAIYENPYNSNHITPRFGKVDATHEENQGVIASYEDSESNKVKDYYDLNSETIFKSNFCTNRSNNAKEICDKDIVIDLESSKEVEILGFTYVNALVKDIESGEAYIQETTQLISFLQ